MNAAGTTTRVTVFPTIAFKANRPKPHIVKLRLDGRERSLSFDTKAHAISWQATARVAADRREAFDLATAQPISEVGNTSTPTCLELAVTLVAADFDGLASRSNQGIVEGLATCLPGLVSSAYAKRVAARAGSKAGAKARGALERAIQKHLTPGDDRALTVEEATELRAFAIASLTLTAVGRTEVTRALKLAATYQNGKTPAASSTLKRKRAALSKFFSFAVDASLIDISPLSRLRREVAHRDEDTVVVIDRAEVGTVAECAALIGCVRSSFHRLFLWVIFMAGLRPSEVCGLRVGDITFTAGEVRGYLTLRRASTEGKARYSVAGEDREVRGLKARKKGATRNVPLSPQLEALLAAACVGKAQDAPVVTSRVGTQVTVSNLDRSFKRARGLWAEAQPVMPSAVQLHVPYSLRHAAATLWLQKMPVEDVAARLGNSPVIVMKAYANVLPSKKEHYSALVDAAYADLPELA